MPARKRAGRSEQKRKSYRDRKRHGDGDLGRLKFVCPAAGDKAAYRSYRAAERELLRILDKPDVPGEKKPCRVYACDEAGCGLYHLTSQEEWEHEAGEGRHAADA